MIYAGYYYMILYKENVLSLPDDIDKKIVLTGHIYFI